MIKIYHIGTISFDVNNDIKQSKTIGRISGYITELIDSKFDNVSFG